VAETFRILIRCDLCPVDGAEPFESGIGPDGRDAMRQHLEVSHGMVFDPPDLADRLRRQA
jgi:hypothetical protein